jgi:hypothetical protein
MADKTIEERIADLEGRDFATKGNLHDAIQAVEDRKFVTRDDLEKRLSQTHSTTSGTSVAAKLCPICGSPGHDNCG